MTSKIILTPSDLPPITLDLHLDLDLKQDLKQDQGQGVVYGHQMTSQLIVSGLLKIDTIIV
jgi:hypothetical protein